MDTMENTKLLTEPWKPRKDFIFPLGMTSGSASGNAHKQDVPISTGARNVFVDQIKEDGIRKELYENERKARENWEEKWGFLKNPIKLWNKEAVKAGLPADVDVFDQKNGNRKLQFCPSTVKSKLELPSSDGIPKLSSGVIGWRSSSRKYDLNHLAGPLYLSRKQTMNPPLGPDEPDLRYQKESAPEWEVRSSGMRLTPVQPHLEKMNRHVAHADEYVHATFQGRSPCKTADYMQKPVVRDNNYYFAELQSHILPRIGAGWKAPPLSDHP